MHDLVAAPRREQPFLHALDIEGMRGGQRACGRWCAGRGDRPRIARGGGCGKPASSRGKRRRVFPRPSGWLDAPTPRHCGRMITRASERSRAMKIKKALEWGGIIAGVVLIAFGIGALAMGVSGRSTVRDNLA